MSQGEVSQVARRNDAGYGAMYSDLRRDVHRPATKPSTVEKWRGIIKGKGMRRIIKGRDALMVEGLVLFGNSVYFCVKNQ